MSQQAVVCLKTFLVYSTSISYSPENVWYNRW